MQYKKVSRKKSMRGLKDTKNTRGKEKERKEMKTVAINQITCLCVLKNLYKMKIYCHIYYKMKRFGIPMSRGAVKELKCSQRENDEADLIKYRKFRDVWRLGTRKSRRTERELKRLQHDRAEVGVINYGKYTYLYTRRSGNHTHYNKVIQTGLKLCRNKMREDIDRVWSLKDALVEFSGGFLGFTYSPLYPRTGGGLI